MAVSSLLLALTVPRVLQWEDLYKEIGEDTSIQSLISQLDSGKLISTKLLVIDGRL